MVSFIATENEIVLYWDLPESFTNGEYYEIYSGDTLIGKTEKCHIKIGGLSPSSAYTYSVYLSNKKEKIGEITAETSEKKNKIDITKPPYNAVGDGKTLNTKAIQKAFDDCTEHDCVYIPKGDFMTGALFMHSNMELYIEKDAILHGTENVPDYEPKIKSRFEGIEMMCYASVLNIGELDRDKGYTAENVKIYGEGTVCGGGLALANNVVEVEKVLLKDYLEALGEKIKECESDITIPGRARPRLINVSCAKNVIIAGITIENGSCWNLHMIYSDQVITYGCTFKSEGVYNGDGWDPDSSTNCTLFGSEFFTGDDSVAIKSGKNPEGNVINRPSEHIKVFDCISHYGHGITIGSEMSGGINDVRIWNCDVRNSIYGVEIKGTKKRGGYVQNVEVRNCDVCRIMLKPVGYNDDGEAAPNEPYFKNYRFENIRISGRFLNHKKEIEACNAIDIIGFSPVENIKFKNIYIDNGDESITQTIAVRQCSGVSFENIYCK